MRHIRNASFLVLLAVSLVSADPFPTCTEQSEACAQGYGGNLCWAGNMYCVEGELWLSTRCVGGSCYDAYAPLYWSGECYNGACT
jgi:hypothetical protein